MKSAIALILLQLVRSSLASGISPIKIIRPLEDVRDNCERDMIKSCSTNVISKNIELRDTISRRLTEEEPVKVIRSRSYSLTVGIKLGPKEEPIQRAKNIHRFLNYGPDTDTCMWLMFDNKAVSDECASALMYINDSSNNHLDQYADIYGNPSGTYERISLTISSYGICFLLSICAICVMLTGDDDDDDDETEESADDSDEVAYTAIPLTATPLTVV